MITCRRIVVLVLLHACLVAHACGQESHGQEGVETDGPSDGPPCLREEHQRVAFLTGHWNVVSRKRISVSSDEWIESHGEAQWRPVLGGCVMEERWSGVVGDRHVEWIQLLAYDFRHEKWERTFVDTSHGNLLESDGFIDDGTLIFNDPQVREGRLLIDRTRLEAVEPDSVLVSFESSVDGGTSWTVLWELRYSRR